MIDTPTPATERAPALLACPACNRANGPTRTACLYCGAALPIGADSVQQPTFRQLEEWEAGYNVIAVPRTPALPDKLPEAAAWLKVAPDWLEQVAGSSVPLPLARLATADEAALTSRQLHNYGLATVLVTDQNLAVREFLPRRARAMQWAENGVTVQLTGGGVPFTAAWDEISVLVTGRLQQNRVEAQERPARNGVRETLDSREISQDEAVLDVYTADLARSWRVQISGFDFSCLGASKKLLAAENFAAFCAEMRERASRAVYQDAYLRVRPLLAQVWPLAQRTDSQGWQRNLRHTTRQITTSTTNDVQFTRFSRLCYCLAAALAQTGNYEL